MLHRIGQGEEIAPGVFESVAQGDEFFPAIDSDQPAVMEIALKLFGLDAKNRLHPSYTRQMGGKAQHL